MKRSPNHRLVDIVAPRRIHSLNVRQDEPTPINGSME